MKNALTGVRTRFKQTATPLAMDWILLCAVLFMMFISYIYNDLIITAGHSLDVWDSIVRGQFINFYSFDFGARSLPAYDFPIYVIFAVWNLPMWILRYFFGVDVLSSAFCLSYMKLMLLMFLAGSAWVLRKICVEMKMPSENIKWVTFLFLSSGFVMSSLFVMTQYDIVMVFFLLIGLLMYIKNRIPAFLVFFSIAVSMKMFALMAFVPLVLLKEKRAVRIFLYTAASVGVTVVSKLLFMLDSDHGVNRYVRGISHSGLASRMILSSELPIGPSGIFVYIALFLALCVYCYVKTPVLEHELHAYSMYIPLLSFSLFLLLCSAHPYWFIMTTPFLPVIMLRDGGKLKINMMLDSIVMIFMLIHSQISNRSTWKIDLMHSAVVSKIFGAVEIMKFPYSVGAFYDDILEKMKVSYRVVAFYEDASWRGAVNFTMVTETVSVVEIVLGTVFFAAMAAVLVLNFPKSKEPTKEPEPVVIERSVVWVRLLAPAVLCLLPVGLYIMSVFVHGLYNT